MRGEKQEILLNVESKETRCAFLKYGKLKDLIVERRTERQLTGNIYRGKVKNILANIQSAFIDIHEGENGFIHISDILENTKKFEQLFDMDFDSGQEALLKERKQPQTQEITQLLSPDQAVLVQVVKEPIGSKGARLTSNVSIAGRYLVLLPNSSHRGVSRKIEDRGSRDRLKQLIHAFEMPQDMGLICRTASAEASKELLIEEAHELLQRWNTIMDGFKKSTEPTLLYAESDLIKRAVLTAMDKKYDRILVDDYATYQKCKRLYGRHGQEQNLKIEFYKEKTPLFEKMQVEREIEKALRRKIWLPSGGYLYFDPTEAMCTIDVNSGRGQSAKGEKGDVEEALVRINLEAAEEIANQLIVRNIGGIVICDFIDMKLKKNQRRVLEKLRECMKDDPAKCTILGMSEFGLIELTRQRNRPSLQQTLCVSCPYCAGSGRIRSHETVSIDLERAIKKLLSNLHTKQIRAVVHPELHRYLEQIDKPHLRKMAEEAGVVLDFGVDDTLHLNDFRFFSLPDLERLEC